jgi:hypothetical protein
MMENTEEVTQNGQSIETGNTGHTRQRNKQKQKQRKPQHNVRWTPLSASKHKYYDCMAIYAITIFRLYIILSLLIFAAPSISFKL